MAKLLEIEFRGADRLLKDLRIAREKALPYAARDALNSAAFAAQAEWRDTVAREFTLRNTFTVRSIRVDKAQGTSLRDMQAVVGSTAPYMADQEEGAIVSGRGKRKAIPGPGAAGQAAGGKRTKLVRARYKLSAISVAAPPGGGYGRRRRNAIAIAVALQRGQRFALLNRSKGNGRALFELTPRRTRVRVKLLWDVSRSSVRVSPTPTLSMSLQRVSPKLPLMCREALLRQLKRHRLLGY